MSVPEARLPQPSAADLVSGRLNQRRSAVRQDIAPGAIPRITLPPLDTERLRQERRQRELQQEFAPAANPGDASRTRYNRHPRRLEVGVVRPIQISAADGQWLPEPDGTRVWMLDISSPGAVAVRAHVLNFNVPAGVYLESFSPSQSSEATRSEGRGPYGTGEFWLPPVEGDSVRLAVVDERPSDIANSDSNLSFDITGIGHIYEDVRSAYSGEPAACEVGATCYSDWDRTGDSVARILFNDSYYQYACSATLVNNASGDYSPLLLTAAHCVSSNALAQTVSAYFFFKSFTCNVFTNNDAYRITNYATYLVSTAVEDSDSSLIQLLGPLPSNAVWAAWTTTEPAIGEALTALHHPLASWQRISIGNRTTDVTSSRYGVTWSQGITEPGSSGGGLFNSAHQLVGQLHGGYSSCSVSGPDSFGKLSIALPLLADKDGRNYLEQGLPDDTLANNSRDHAYATATQAVMNNLIIKKAADDWFKYSVSANQGFTVNISDPSAAERVEIYKGTDTTPIATGTTALSAGAGSTASDFYVRVFLPVAATYSAVRSVYGISFQDMTGSPSIRTDPPYSPTHEAAGLTGWMNGTLTSWFEWSTDPTFATKSETPHGVNSWSVQYTLHGLTPETKYYVRFVADWAGAPLYGNVISFATQPIGSFKYSPADGSTNVYADLSYVSWAGYADSYDIYFGQAADPPFLAARNADPTRNEQSAGFPVYPYLHPSSTYYWRVVAKYQGITASSSLLSFTTKNVLAASAYSDFGGVSLARNSGEKQIVLTATEPIHIAAVNTTGDFTQRNDCIGAAVSNSASCSVYVTFRPTALGRRVGTLIISSDKYPVPLSAPLSGTGTELIIDLYRPSRPSRPAYSPSAASFEVPLSLVSRANFTCSVSPAVATCTLVRRESSALITLVPIPRVVSRRKRNSRRPRMGIESGKYVVSISGPNRAAKVDIPIELR